VLSRLKHNETLNTNEPTLLSISAIYRQLDVLHDTFDKHFH